MSHISPVDANNSIILSIRSPETDNIKLGLCHSLEKDSSSAQISQLMQKLYECESKIQSLMQLVGRMADQQYKVVCEVVKMKCRALSITPPELETLNSPTLSTLSATSSVQDDTLELDDSLSDSDSDDWESLVPSLSSWVPTPFNAPVSISRRRNSSLDRIEEEDEEVSLPLSPVPQL